MIDDLDCRIAFGQFIQNGREKQRLYQTQVADLLGVSQPYYSQIEKGNRNVDFVFALKICDVLHLNINKFITQYSSKTKNP